MLVAKRNLRSKAMGANALYLLLFSCERALASTGTPSNRRPNAKEYQPVKETPRVRDGSSCNGREGRRIVCRVEQCYRRDQHIRSLAVTNNSTGGSVTVTALQSGIG